MRIGSHTVATGFTNNGLLEARSGTLVAFGTATTARVNGELRGGGAYVVATNIFLADSATLAPGDSEAADGTGASTVGLLTVTGNVALASATALNFQFGSAVAAGADYDAVAVTGSLTLDGVLNIEERPGFSLSGRYRLFTFRADGASVTDNGLTVPQGYQVLVDRDNGWVDLVYPSRATIMTVR